MQNWWQFLFNVSYFCIYPIRICKFPNNDKDCELILLLSIDSYSIEFAA